ncbi:hypothetical protein XELAEV_18018540mg [Xenopus laevis]|uniref:BTB domain-containing protein n=1 Tax=Xenopus laevis TaxID=8355 RepID=A0A974HU26_XENLA|nr:hypothetical protein XELAEV_18018540mg [Xenopus laevis]
MGSLSSRLLWQESKQKTVGSCEHRKRKRSLECQCESETDDELENLLNTPRRKKLKSTSKYIYQTLFLNGENSDIKICALGQEWSLHKIYLCQSGYFSSMFCGSWRESSMNVIELEIPDHNIDAEALQVAFGSLYRDDVLIKPSRVIAILAAACMLQLDGLIQQCGETMKETISVQTVCGYSSAAGIYGLDSVKKKCLEWLLNNLMTHQSVDLFKELSISMMEQLISSPDLLVMQVEMDVYTALKKWMFLQLVPSWNGSLKQLLPEADAWFSKRRKVKQQERWMVSQHLSDTTVGCRRYTLRLYPTVVLYQMNAATSSDISIFYLISFACDLTPAFLCRNRRGVSRKLCCQYHLPVAACVPSLEIEENGTFLECEQGSPFMPVFRHLRLQYIISDLASARIVERDCLIPSEWLSSIYKQQWFTMLRAEQDNDMGPQEINKDDLENSSMRCGRKLTKDGDVPSSRVGSGAITPRGHGQQQPCVKRVSAVVFTFCHNLRGEEDLDISRLVNRADWKILIGCLLKVPEHRPLLVLSRRIQYCWRWTGFNFGFDLLVTYTNRYIIFKRNTLNQPCSCSVSLQPHRNIAFRLRLASFDNDGKVICSKTSGYQILSLEKDQEQVVMNLDSRHLLFPLYICCNFLYTSPERRTDAPARQDNPEN